MRIMRVSAEHLVHPSMLRDAQEPSTIKYKKDMTLPILRMRKESTYSHQKENHVAATIDAIPLSLRTPLHTHIHTDHPLDPFLFMCVDLHVTIIDPDPQHIPQAHPVPSRNCLLCHPLLEHAKIGIKLPPAVSLLVSPLDGWTLFFLIGLLTGLLLIAYPTHHSLVNSRRRRCCPRLEDAEVRIELPGAIPLFDSLNYVSELA
ncbi:hypothetical protein QBC35DRAFT_127936 [Podospora australis]|uniref:Uncharacterized protein n=1 Tax=Podospora australis TaxID=1536484 RepID=A0AAN6WWL5_9PEZI|nr:hypothetical protein QBC35DRAFT_127936 [Podospora australis]